MYILVAAFFLMIGLTGDNRKARVILKEEMLLALMNTGD